MNLKEYLKQQGITIYRLALNTGIPRTTLEDIVNGRTDLRESKFSTLQKLSLYLEIPIEDLVEERGMVFYPAEVKSKEIQKNNQSGHTGVCFKTRRSEFNAYIKIWGRNVDLGRFKSLEEAVAARRAAERLKALSTKPDINI